MIVMTRNIVSTMAYLTGVKRELWDKLYPDETVEKMKKLDDDKSARTIRYLCKMRTTLMRNYVKTDNAIQYDFKNILDMEWFDHDNIRWLLKNGLEVVLVNKRVQDYYIMINEYITRKIESCAQLFPDWVEWDYMKDLIVFSKFNDKTKSKKEFNRFMDNINDYPCHVYIHWKPEDCGYLFDTDAKFLKVIYKMHNKNFDDSGKTTDVSVETKENIYDFIKSNNKVDIIVDCENSDAYKLYGMLKNLNTDELSKIHKIILYDDPNTNACWKFVAQHTDIPVVYIEVERVVEHKSLVDVRLTAGICKEHYQQEVDGFVLLSSDSDYWALIQSLSDANFLVMVEYDKCGSAIKDAFKEHGIYYCYLDDFCVGNIEEFKRTVLLNKLKEYLPNDIIGRNSKELAKEIFMLSGIHADKSEITKFHDKYIKTLSLHIDNDGNFTISLSK